MLSVGIFIGRRLLIAIPTLIAATSITYFLVVVSAGEVIPGLDLGSNVRPEDIARLRESLGLDRPVYEQYLAWLGGVLTGDLGRSMIDRTPISQEVFQRLPNTLLLSSTALILGVVFAVPLGVLSALRRGSRLDVSINAASVAGFAIPQFWLGIIMISVFSLGLFGLGLPYLPAAGASDPIRGGDPIDRLTHLILPAVTLALPYIAVWSRYVRSSVISTVSLDYVRTARSKGLSERQVIYGHALRNALVPLITVVALELPRLVGGSVLIEVVFGWPGVGRLAYQSAIASDVTAVMGIAAFFAILVVIGSVVADLLYAVVDPRVRL